MENREFQGLDGMFLTGIEYQSENMQSVYLINLEDRLNHRDSVLELCFTIDEFNKQWSELANDNCVVRFEAC